MTALQVKELKGIRKAVGLIGKKKAEAVLIRTRFGIHTFGLKFPIDVLVLDKNCKIVKLKENLLPNRIFLWNPKFDSVLELPRGTIRKIGLQIGRKLDIV